ncbi:MAG: serine/threonine-protein kinase [Proteobacteria bacterium]|nr:serine/threonine-protein kinase [Pseudomonadota bacterium]
MARRPSPVTEDSEEGRAFLQTRVALFWKVVFFLMLFGTVLGAVGAIVDPGMDTAITLGQTGLAGTFWWLCRRGTRSIRFSRVIDGVGLPILAFLGALQGRFLLGAFAHDHTVASPEGALMADGYVSMMEVAATAMFVAIRAALIPSRPRRTIFVTALIGAPLILVAAIVVPVADRGLAWRAPSATSVAWLPANSIVMWGITIITCTVISWVIYGLRAEVREARRFGQYVLERKIGEGAMGVVYRATHALLRRPAAIKLLLKDRASERDLERFEREVQLTSRLAHPNTISIFDYGRTAEGVFYYVMEYLDGLDLQRLVERYGPVEPARAIHLLAQICGALAEAHSLGLIHRDIKPANIVPGQHVFQAASVIEICSKHMLETPMPPSQRLGTALPADLEALVLACLAKDRDARPASAAELRASLLACVDAGRHDVPAARRWWQAHHASQAQPSADVASGSRPATMAIDLGSRMP